MVVLAVLACTWNASAAFETREDDALARLIRRPAASGWVTGGDLSPWWLHRGDQLMPFGLIGSVQSAPASDPLDLTRTTVGIATTGRVIGRPDDMLGITATFSADSGSIRLPSSNGQEEEVSFGLHHGWRLGTDVHLRSSLGWRPDPTFGEPTIWGGIGLRFDF